MNSSESESDPLLRESLRALPIPDTPGSVESRVHRRIRHRRIQRTGLASGTVLALVAALFAWEPWGVVPAPLVHNPKSSPPIAKHTPAPPGEIPLDQLDVLFAPPPVDPLTILDDRNESMVAALNRLEVKK